MMPKVEKLDVHKMPLLKGLFNEIEKQYNLIELHISWF